MMEMNKGKIPFLNIILLAIFIILFVFATVRYGPELTLLAKEPEKFREAILAYGYTSILVFIAVEIVQVVIAAIPGELIQIAGGYMYGALLGTLYLVVGAVAGSFLAFFASRLLGYPLVQAFVSEGKLKRFNYLLGSPRSDVIMFVLYLLPGIPKDILTYIAGLTPVNPWKFLLISTGARLPALFASAYIGANLENENYLQVVVLLAIAVILFFLGILYRDRLIDKLHKLLHSQGKE